MNSITSNTFELNCWVLGDDPKCVFPVEIASMETVGALKKHIEKKHQFDDLDANALDLWNIKINWKDSDLLKMMGTKAVSGVA
ncbi:hypothetical protein DFH29DRAFT_1005946 [Suillus ampliporus]|nr:hypothetical protein DFH29DRAFT_1005946 [Suillus ampliporus]